MVGNGDEMYMFRHQAVAEQPDVKGTGGLLQKPQIRNSVCVVKEDLPAGISARCDIVARVTPDTRKPDHVVKLSQLHVSLDNVPSVPVFPRVPVWWRCN